MSWNPIRWFADAYQAFRSLGKLNWLIWIEFFLSQIVSWICSVKFGSDSPFWAAVILVTNIGSSDAILKANVVGRMEWDEVPKFFKPKEGGSYEWLLGLVTGVIPMAIQVALFFGGLNQDAVKFIAVVITAVATGYEFIFYWLFAFLYRTGQKPVENKWLPWLRLPDSPTWLKPLVFPQTVAMFWEQKWKAVQAFFCNWALLAGYYKDAIIKEKMIILVCLPLGGLIIYLIEKLT